MSHLQNLAKVVEDLLLAKEEVSQSRGAMTGEDADLSKEAEMRHTTALIVLETRFKFAREALAAYQKSSTLGQLASV